MMTLNSLTDIMALFLVDVLLPTLTYCLLLTLSLCKHTSSSTVGARQPSVVQGYGQTV